jgi:O-acetylserine/cysteine efflux transporter
MRGAKTLFLAIAAPFCFGMGFTLAKPAVAHFPPLMLVLCAYIFIAIVTLITVRRPFQTPWYHALLITSFAVTLQGALVFQGVKGLESTTANLLLQMQVPAAVALGWLVLGERLTSQKAVGTLIAIAGVVIIIGLPQEKPPLIPALSIIAGGVFWAFGQVLIRKFSKDDGELTLKANAILGVPQLLVATWFLEQGHWQAITTATCVEWSTLAFVCVVGFYGGYLAWFALLKRTTMDEAAPWILMMTPIGLVAAVVILGERMTLVQIVGALILMTGLAIVNGIGVPRNRNMHPSPLERVPPGPNPGGG